MISDVFTGSAVAAVSLLSVLSEYVEFVVDALES